MPFAGSLYGAGLIYLVGWYGVMVDALKSLRSKIFPRSVVWGSYVGNRNGLAGLVMYAGRGMFF